ncbi:hypothetical protein A5819_003475 [Enterococcus sp. 7E2_DIV0204]|uniref:hypothetical protein n=1 Tax=unclassified Enterococcus TaxID=2608891 RepID=UPI000B66CBB8|nr:MULTISPECIES: hypothetical protein [unclassified Enterococcus]OTN83925.1 hypothetical protein A5819_003475 [Enterococcus sp. 7E2_DIV0204]OTP46833.1 hypothetical protein A5884_003711 [Enterococcus sp. 7D2_DIV0200]
MKIEFHMLDKTSNTFRKVYFKEWDGHSPVFVSTKTTGRNYWDERQAEEDLKILAIVTSPTAKTLSIKLVP